MLSNVLAVFCLTGFFCSLRESSFIFPDVVTISYAYWRCGVNMLAYYTCAVFLLKEGKDVQRFFC